jgi:purine-binding chemotaxis protein CheW
MIPSSNLLVFLLAEGRFALNLSIVERVIPSVAITPLPNAPQVVLGVIKIQEQIIPIVNIRQRFHFAEREINLTDHIVIAKTKRRTVGLLVDSVYGVTEFDENRIVPAEKILPALQYIKGIIQLDDGLVIINDLDQFLSFDEEKKLDKALTRSGINDG